MKMRHTPLFVALCGILTLASAHAADQPNILVIMVRDAIWQALQERAPKPLPDYCRPGVIGTKRPGEDTSHD
jgi:hypothetical protein